MVPFGVEPMQYGHVRGVAYLNMVRSEGWHDQMERRVKEESFKAGTVGYQRQLSHACDPKYRAQSIRETRKIRFMRLTETSTHSLAMRL